MAEEASNKRVLIYRLGSLGDTLVALPCFHLIARTFPGAERRLLTNFPVHAKASAAASVLGASGLVHGYMRYTVGMRRIDKLLRLAWQIRRFRPDVLVFLMDIRPWNLVERDVAFFRMCGVKRIVGVTSEEDLKHRVDAETGLHEPEASRLARAVAELGDAQVDEPGSWDLRLTAAEREAARVALGPLAGRPLMVCGPGTKMQAKDWGRENWQALLGQLSRDYPDFGLALVGAAGETEVSEFAAQPWRGEKVNLCGKLTPRETAAVMEQAAQFLGPDSGPMHLAACVGTPCVIAFSARGMPRRWYPAGKQHEVVYHQTSCQGCGLEVCTVEGRRCLTSISVAEMAAAVGRVLDKRTV